jgi:antitoxin component of MazEF toxin-antitoxin module
MPVVRKSGDRLSVDVPDEVARALDLQPGDELDYEVFQGGFAMRRAQGLNAEELATLQKIADVRFAERTQEAVAKILSPAEARVLKRLEEKGAVHVYDGGQYKDRPVYSIAKAFYGLLGKASQPAPAETMAGKKFEILANPNDARAFLAKADADIKSGSLVVVRGFDKKYYVTTRDAVDSEGSKMIAALRKKAMRVEDLAAECNADVGLARTVLEVLRESGDVIEKKRGEYALA